MKRYIKSNHQPMVDHLSPKLAKLDHTLISPLVVPVVILALIYWLA